MLAPNERQTIADALRPPAGFALDIAVGTTFSLNLDAALTPAAAFAIQQAAYRDDEEGLEPLQLLDAVRRHTGRITIFFQSGQIPVAEGRQLYAFLEGSIVPSASPRGGVFHPKVWVVRFSDDAGNVTHRALCATRNLTHDRSWDTLLRFDSLPAGVKSSVKAQGLARFVAALPDLAIVRIDDERRSSITALAEELKSVRWALPAHFDSARFIPIGVGSSPRTLFGPGQPTRLAVVSPFLSPGFIGKLPEATETMKVVSSPSSLDDCADSVAAKFGEETWVLNPDATPVGFDDEPLASRTADDPEIPFQGLHAKLFVADYGRTAKVYTGSANATVAAFNKNVEFMTELTGPAKRIGVRPLFANPNDGIQTLSTFLMQHRLDMDGPRDTSEAADVLDGLRREIARIPLEARASSVSGEDVFKLSFTGDQVVPPLPDSATWKVWPITLPERAAAKLEGGSPVTATFNASFKSITPFLAGELRLGGERTRFVLCAQLVEAPGDRESRTLRLLLENSERLIRYLLLLLADERDDIFGQLDLLKSLDESGSLNWKDGFDSLPLLEAMLRTLAKSPKRLAEVHNMIQDLRTIAGEDPSFDTHGLLEQLRQVWDPIWSATSEFST